MGQGGKRDKDKSKKQSSDMHKQKEDIMFENQHKGQPVPELQSENTVSKDDMTKALKENMKAVKKN